MYDWLSEALDDADSLVLTANRRLARELRHCYDREQLAAGNAAWRTPAIFAWRDWIGTLYDECSDGDQPLRITDSQARVLFEQVLREDISDPFLSFARLAKQCLDSWNRLQEWCVPLTEWQSAAAGQDQRIFARAAGRYTARLADEHWVDSARLPGSVIELLERGQVAVPRRIRLAGFDRLSPQLQALLSSLEAAGARWDRPREGPQAVARLVPFEHREAELRAAGHWARECLESDPSQRIAIVAGGLEQDADRIATLVREGFCPGWQVAGPSHAAVVNLSYGKPLAEYPAIGVALQALRWMTTGLRGRDLSILLRSPYLAGGSPGSRSRCELWLREWPDRDWTLAMLEGLLAHDRRTESFRDVTDWLQRFQNGAALLSQAGPRQAATNWAGQFDTALAGLGWPGSGSLSSEDFQLVNRWRKLLNEFARLDLLLGETASSEALSRLAGLAADAIFQPEQQAAVISILGPLEAAGLHFDGLWLTGATATEWPPQSRPLPLVAREIQRRYRMPDASPADTATFARAVLHRLQHSTAELVASYPESTGDAEQLPSKLLADLPVVQPLPDPGWFAARLRTSVGIENAADSVPAVLPGEKIRGGAATIARQKSDPFSAFAFGRLGIKRIASFTSGIAPNVRGNLVHAALQHLLHERPSSTDIASWGGDERARRIGHALAHAFRRFEAQADDVLRQILSVEKERTERLLAGVLELDSLRPGFSVASVEGRLRASFAAVDLDLRCDRLDLTPAGEYLVLDYKTGAARKLVSNDEITDLQLVVYTCALDRAVAGIGFYNVASREIAIDGAGLAFDEDSEWPQRLAAWQEEVVALAQAFAAGDVRLNVRQKAEEARPLSLLSRFPEVQRES